jgi:PhzF family phenazine biosynthesis protein
MMGPVPTATWCVAFADGPGGGNPAPIVTDADQLSAEQMQQAAAEFGFETAFVLAPRAGGVRRFRYFVLTGAGPGNRANIRRQGPGCRGR